MKKFWNSLFFYLFKKGWIIFIALFIIMLFCVRIDCGGFHFQPAADIKIFISKVFSETTYNNTEGAVQ